MRQRQDLSLQMKPVLAEDCEPDIEPRPQAIRTLGLVINNQGELCPQVLLECGDRTETITFDQGFRIEENILDHGETLRDFQDSANVWFERLDPDDPEVCVLVFYGRRTFEKLVAKTKLAPFMRIFVSEDDEPLEEDDVELEQAFW